MLEEQHNRNPDGLYHFFQYILTSVYRRLKPIEPQTSMVAVSNAAYTTIGQTDPFHVFQRGHLQETTALCRKARQWLL